MKLAGWGRYPLIDAELKSPTSIDELVEEILKNNAIARGNGRAYGDSAINVKNTIMAKLKMKTKSEFQPVLRGLKLVEKY